MTDVYLHVGLPKTGTSFLQERCFPQLGDVHVIRHGYRMQPTGMVEWLWRVVDAYPLFLNIDEQRTEMDQFLSGVNTDKVLITSARLFGDPFLGFRDHVQVTDALRRLFPAAKIILTIRRQDDFLESLYRQILRSYHCPTIDGFLNYAHNRFANPVRPPPTHPNVNVWRLDYRVYAQNYVAAFGRHNVLVLPQEMLRADPRRFHTELAVFMGVEPYYPPDGSDANPSDSLLSCRIALLLNRFVRAPGWERRPWRVIPHQPFTYLRENVVNHLPSPRGRLISDKKRALIMDIHRASNQKLDAEYGINLREYGYY